MRIDGVLHGELIHADGTIEKVERHNMIVDGGFDFICDVIGNPTQPGAMGYIGVGTGTTASSASQTALGTELSRNAATYTHTAGTKVFTLSADFDEGDATGAITEAAVFNAATNGTMLDRVVFDVINKGANDKFKATFEFTLS
jgi:hypothetical protein